MKLREIAVRITEHLRRFEADSKINKPTPPSTISPYFHAYASPAGRYVGVCYVSFQGWQHLSKRDAEKYLAWLDAGYIGKHHRALEESHD